MRPNFAGIAKSEPGTEGPKTNERKVIMDERNRKKALSKEQCKIRVLAIYRMLDEGRRLTSTDILRRLASQYGIHADRKTIYSDISAIDRFMPIDSIPSRFGGYKKYDVLGACEDA